MKASVRDRDGRSGTVLLVEDSDVVRDVVARMLESDGLTVLQATGGEEALALARRGDAPVDLLVTDIVMPDMGGIDAVREIVKNDPDAKILMCSAMGQQALVVEAIQAGAKDFVVKPFQPSRVLEAVQRVLG